MITNFLQDNPFASGLLATTVLAALLAYLRNVPAKLLRLFWTQFSVCLEVKSSDQAFTWLSLWLDKQPYSQRTRQLMLETYVPDNDNEDLLSDIFEPGVNPRRKKTNRPKILFTPAPGQHIFWYNRRLVWLNRSKDTTPTTSTDIQRHAESFTLYVFGRDQAVVREIIHDAMLLALPDAVPETLIVPSGDGRWQTAIHKRPRTTESVILDGNTMEQLVADAKAFLTSRAWYESLGVPYRRGYLFYGVPGSGKTSAILALAGDLDLDVYVINFGDRYLDDGRLNYLLAQVPAGNIVLLEDIDSIFVEKQATQQESVTVPVPIGGGYKNRTIDAQGITFSGLLNALDGVTAREGRLLFMTTNHKDALDAALIRPGRVDAYIEFGHATHAQARRIFARFFPTADQALAEQFGQATPPKTVSMATIQDHLLIHRSDPDDALKTWQEQHKIQ